MLALGRLQAQDRGHPFGLSDDFVDAVVVRQIGEFARRTRSGEPTTVGSMNAL